MNKKETSVLSVIALIAILYGLINSIDSISQSIVDFFNSAGPAFVILVLIALGVKFLKK